MIIVDKKYCLHIPVHSSPVITITPAGHDARITLIETPDPSIDETPLHSIDCNPFISIKIAICGFSGSNPFLSNISQIMLSYCIYRSNISLPLRLQSREIGTPIHRTIIIPCASKKPCLFEYIDRSHGTQKKDQFHESTLHKWTESQKWAKRISGLPHL